MIEQHGTQKFSATDDIASSDIYFIIQYRLLLRNTVLLSCEEAF